MQEIGLVCHTVTDVKHGVITLLTPLGVNIPLCKIDAKLPLSICIFM